MGLLSSRPSYSANSAAVKALSAGGRVGPDPVSKFAWLRSTRTKQASQIQDKMVTGLITCHAVRDHTVLRCAMHT
jgi:hypothetical protein